MTINSNKRPPIKQSRTRAYQINEITIPVLCVIGHWSFIGVHGSNVNCWRETITQKLFLSLWRSMWEPECACKMTRRTKDALISEVLIGFCFHSLFCIFCRITTTFYISLPCIREKVSGPFVSVSWLWIGWILRCKLLYSVHISDVVKLLLNKRGVDVFSTGGVSRITAHNRNNEYKIWFFLLKKKIDILCLMCAMYFVWQPNELAKNARLRFTECMSERERHERHVCATQQYFDVFFFCFLFNELEFHMPFMDRQNNQLKYILTAVYTSEQRENTQQPKYVQTNWCSETKNNNEKVENNQRCQFLP